MKVYLDCFLMKMEEFALSCNETSVGLYPALAQRPHIISDALTVSFSSFYRSSSTYVEKQGCTNQRQSYIVIMAAIIPAMSSTRVQSSSILPVPYLSLVHVHGKKTLSDTTNGCIVRYICTCFQQNNFKVCTNVKLFCIAFYIKTCPTFILSVISNLSSHSSRHCRHHIEQAQASLAANGVCFK